MFLIPLGVSVPRRKTQVDLSSNTIKEYFIFICHETAPRGLYFPLKNVIINVK